jgi:hypothetical protein
MPTLAGWETRIREHSEKNRLCLTRTDIRRAAKHFARRQADVLDLDDDLRTLGLVPDPTPLLAFRSISRNDLAAARRLGLRVTRA